MAGKIGPAVIPFWNQTTTVKYINISKQTCGDICTTRIPNTLYTTWLKSMFEKFDDITEVYIRLAPLNRMVISFDPKLENEAVVLDHFTVEHPWESTQSIRKSVTQAVSGETVQILTKLSAMIKTV